MNRKRLIVLLGLAAALSLTACGSDKKTETEAQTKSAVQETEAVTEADADETETITEATMTEATADETEATTDTTDEAVTEAMTDATDEAVTEATTDTTDEAVTEATTDTTDEAVTEATTDITAEIAAEAMSDITAEATVDTIAEVAAEAMTNTDTDETEVEAASDEEEEVFVIDDDEAPGLDGSEEAGLDDGEADEETEEEADETEAFLEPVTPSDYLVKDAEQYVTPGDLEGIEVTKYIYDITDDMVEEYIQYDLDMYSEEIDVDRASRTADIVYVELTSSIQGSKEEPYTESTYFTVGDEEYGAEFDEKLTGVTAGDEIEFSITFGDEIWIEEWIGQTVDFTAAITAVSEIIVPEYNEDFVMEYTDYETIEEYEASIRESLVLEYEEISYTDVIDSLLEAAVDLSEFSSYPQELYDSCKAEILSFYSAFAGTEEEEEIYEMFGITEDDIKSDIEYYVYRRLLVSAICAEHNIKLSQEDYFTYLEENAPYYEYESAADFEADYTRETLIWSLYESMAADILYEAANVTEEPYVEELVEDEEYLEEELEEESDAATEEAYAEAADAVTEVADAADTDAVPEHTTE